MAKRIVACDLDGTLAIYKGERDHMFIGEPIKCMVDAIKVIRECNGEVWIFTARLSDPQTHDVAKKVIEDWLKKHDIQVDGITCVKQKFFSEIWDDRAIQIITNTGKVANSAECHSKIFEPLFTPAVEPDTCDDGNKSYKRIETIMNSKVFKSQVGGSHYSAMAIQPGIYSSLNNLTHYEASIVKYISRHKNKNGLQDIKKVIECAKQLAAIEYGVDL